MFFFSENDTSLTFKPISLESAYLLILNDDLRGAFDLFSNIDSPRAKWGKVLVQILQGYVEKEPSYFDIRNFYEIDLDFLLKNNKVEYVELLLGSADFLVAINQEVYKFAARVLLENDITKSAKNYLDKSKNVFYNDPELHFMYTKYFIRIREFEFAKYHIEECLRILPDYYPAKKIRNELEDNFV